VIGLLNGRGSAHITLQGESLAPCRFNLRPQASAVLDLDVSYRHVRPFLGKAPCRASANPAGRAGDEGDLGLQHAHRGISPSRYHSPSAAPSAPSLTLGQTC